MFTYDFENRMIGHTTSAGNVWDYTYDGLGNRLQKHFDTSITRYVTDLSGSLPRTLALASGYGSGGVLNWYVYGLGLLSEGDTVSFARKYYLEDGLGNIRFLTSDSGSKKTSTNYDPFGNVRSLSGALPP